MAYFLSNNKPLSYVYTCISLLFSINLLCGLIHLPQIQILVSQIMMVIKVSNYDPCFEDDDDDQSQQWLYNDKLNCLGLTTVILNN